MHQSNNMTRGVAAPLSAVTAASRAADGCTMPVVIEPKIGERDLLACVSARKAQVERTLLKHGAILFRGFTTQHEGDLERFATMTGGPLMDYQDRATKRSHVKGKTFTSTDTPRRYHIPMHNESSYAAIWPLRIVFYCVTPAQSGGCTPLADSRRVWQRIAPEVRETFAERGVLYVRNFGNGPGMGWRDGFQVNTREELEAYCDQAGIEYEWISEEHLRTTQRRRCDAVHPLTGEPVWFCHATVLHVSALDPTLGDTLLRQYGEENLPYNTYYGDGSPIEADTLAHLREAYEAETVRFDWQAGDALLLDSMLVAHARDPYQGDRKILSLLCTPTTWKDVDCVHKQPNHDTGVRMTAKSTHLDAPKSNQTTSLTDAKLDELLLQTLAKVLEVPVVRMDDNFFDLGGDSLTATRVIARLRDETNIDLPLSAFFNVDCIKELAVILMQTASA